MADYQTSKTGNAGRTMGTLGLVCALAWLYSKLFIYPDFASPPLLVMAALAAIGGGVWLASNFRTLGDKFGGRGTLFLTTTSISAALVLGILGGVNYIAVKKPKSWDLTKDQVFSLSDQTTGVLKGLKEEVTVTAFYATIEPEFLDLSTRLRQYREVTDKLKAEILDPQKHLAEVKEFNISQTGPRVIVRAGQKEARAKDTSEEALTNAISEVTRGAAKKIYFSKGHGERSITDATERGMKLLVDALKGEGFQIDELQLSDHKEMPADAQTLVIAGPVGALLEGEAKLVHTWVEQKNGKLVFFADPGVNSGFEAQLLTWGAKLGADIVLDPESQEPTLAIAQEYAEHPISAARSSPFKLATVFPLARSVQKAGAPPGWTLTEVAKTGARAWGETSSIAGGTAQFDAGQDLKGPVPLAMALQHGAGETDARVVVVGNSAFVANGYLRLGGNKDFALNAIAWASHDESKIAIRPKQRQSNHLFLSGDQKNFMRLFAGVVLPFSLLFAGLLVWQTRRAR
jgi:ABC-type uncharacterized transport system involved in gliding motility auxiliary subunit